LRSLPKLLSIPNITKYILFAEKKQIMGKIIQPLTG